MVPSVIVPKWIAHDSGISPEAVVLYVALAGHMNWQTRECWPHMRRLAQLSRISLRTAFRRFRELEGIGAVQRKRTQHGNRYHLPEKKPDPARPTCHQWHVRCATSGTSEPPVSITELKSGNLFQEQEAADVQSTGLVQTSEKAAAAAKPEIPEKPPEARPVSQPVSAATPLAAETYRKLAAGHSEPGQPVRSLNAVQRVLQATSDPKARAAELVRSMKRWREVWNRPGNERKYVPQIWRWIEEGDWMLPPVTQDDVEREAAELKRKAEERERKAKRDERESLDREDALFREKLAAHGLTYDQWNEYGWKDAKLAKALGL